MVPSFSHLTWSMGRSLHSLSRLCLSFAFLIFLLFLKSFFSSFSLLVSFAGFSFPQPLNSGMPQGSVLDFFFPLVILCTCFLGDLVQSHGFICNLNANDSQVYISMSYLYPEFHTHKFNWIFLHFCLNVVIIMGLFFLKSIPHSPLLSS